MAGLGSLPHQTVLLGILRGDQDGGNLTDTPTLPLSRLARKRQDLGRLQLPGGGNVLAVRFSVRLGRVPLRVGPARMNVLFLLPFERGAPPSMGIRRGGRIVEPRFLPAPGTGGTQEIPQPHLITFCHLRRHHLNGSVAQSHWQRGGERSENQWAGGFVFLLRLVRVKIRCHRVQTKHRRRFTVQQLVSTQEMRLLLVPEMQFPMAKILQSLVK